MISCMQARRIRAMGGVCLTLAGLGRCHVAALPQHWDDRTVAAGVRDARVESGRASDRPRCGGNPIGWLMLANGLARAASAVAITYAGICRSRRAGALPAGVGGAVHGASGPLLFVCPTAIALFPDGRIPSRLGGGRGRDGSVVCGTDCFPFGAAYSDESPMSRPDAPLPSRHRHPL